MSSSLLTLGQNEPPDDNRPPEIKLKTIPEYHFNLAYGWNNDGDAWHVELGLNKDIFNLMDEKLRIGFGTRFGLQNNKNRSFTSAHPAIKDVSADIDTIFLESAYSVALNFYLNAEYFVTRKISVGANMDLLGITMGPDDEADYRPGATSAQNNYTPESGINAFPTRANAFSFGNSKGCLNSQLFVRVEPSRRVAFRFGLAYFYQEFSTERSYGTNSAYRFENNGPGFFAGITFNRFDEK